MKTEDALGRILAGFQRMEKRLESLEGRLTDVEDETEPLPEAPPTKSEGPPPVQQRYDRGEERDDPFAPEVRRASQSKHQSAVNKALSMLGLVPDDAKEQAQRQEQGARHQAAIQKALSVLRVGSQPAAEDQAQQSNQQSAKHKDALGKALTALRAGSQPAAEEQAQQAEQQSAKHQEVLGKALNFVGKTAPAAEAADEPRVEPVDEPLLEPSDEAPAEPLGELPDGPVDETSDDPVVELPDEPVGETSDAPVVELPDETSADPLDETSDDPVIEMSEDTPAEALVDELAEASADALDEAFDEPRDATSSEVLAEALDETSDETSLEALNEALELTRDETDELLSDEVLDEVAAAVEAESATIPLPDLDFLDAAPGDAAEDDAFASVDLEMALDIDLERPRTGARDYAVAILNALVLLGAAVAALYAAGIFRADGIAQGSWREIGVGAGAVLTGAFALFALRVSIHLRGALAGVSALLLHALLLMLLAPRMPLQPALVVGACVLASALGAGLVLQMAHPLALFLGFGVALALPPSMGLQPELFLPYAVAVNLATGLCALRLNRLQASVAAAVVTTVFLMTTAHDVGALYGALLAVIYLGQVLTAPFRASGQTRAAAVLAVPAFVFTAWTVHVLYDGPGWIKVGALFATATGVGFVALQMTRRQDLIRGVLKAGAVLLLLSALPAGLSTHSLAPFALFLSLLFGVFALSLYDAYLRAVGSLTLIVAVALILRDPSAPMLLAAAVSATVLCAVSAKTSNPRSLRILLGAIAHGSLLYAVVRLVPAEFVAYVWLALALAYQAAVLRWKLYFLEAGAALAAGAAAVWVCLALPPDALRFLITGVALVPHFRLLDRARGAYAPDVLLLTAEVMLLAALAIWLPGPVGLLVSLAALALLYVPYAPLQDTLRRHAHLLALALLARCFLADITQWPVAQPWFNLRFAAMLACAVPALLNVRLAHEARAVAASLAGAVAGLAVLLESGAWTAGLAAWGIVMAIGYVIATVGRGSRRSAEGAEADGSRRSAASAEADSTELAPADSDDETEDVEETS